MQDADEASKGDGQARRPFTISTLVCAPPYSLEQWQIATPLLERWLPADDTGSRAPVYTTMLAARVEALLRDPAGSAGSFDQWVQAYLDRLRAMVSVKELPRELRGVMIDWIPWEDPRSVPLPVHNPPGRTLLADVLAASIDTIVQFSKRTPRYQVLLMDRLQETILPEGIANEFRHQLVRAVLQAREVTDERSMRTGPTERLLEHQNARRLGGALSRFLLNLASRPLPQLGATLGDAFLALWHDLNRDPAIQAVTLPLGGQAGSADGAGTWNLATVLDRYRDIKVIYPMPIDVTRASIRGSKDESVESFFAAPLSRRRDTLALGIVCGIEPDRAAPAATSSSMSGWVSPWRSPWTPGKSPLSANCARST